MLLYRYIDTPRDNSIKIGFPLSDVELMEYTVIGETTCGFWIQHRDGKYIQTIRGREKVWVSKTGMKRFAYPTKNEALHNFIKRKEKQVKIYKRNLALAESALQFGIKEKNNTK